MVIASDIFARIEASSEDELHKVTKPIYAKVEALGKIMQIDMSLKDSVRRVLHYATTLYWLWTESRSGLEEMDIKDSCIDLLKRITKDTATDTRDALNLSKEIMEEVVMKLKSMKGGD